MIFLRAVRSSKAEKSFLTKPAAGRTVEPAHWEKTAVSSSAAHSRPPRTVAPAVYPQPDWKGSPTADARHRGLSW
jgi:hypothetical protein